MPLFLYVQLCTKTCSSIVSADIPAKFGNIFQGEASLNGATVV